MNSERIRIRAATAADAPVIARVLGMAFGEDSARRYGGEDYLTIFEELARTEGTQYSYRQALVAEVDGMPAGMVVGYDGARLHELRERTFALLRSYTGSTPTMEDETQAGEFYLDSIGVLPEFRRCGIGGRLLAAMRDKAFAEGYERVGLLVDVENPDAERLYFALGFEEVGSKTFFGHRMRHLQQVAGRNSCCQSVAGE